MKRIENTSLDSICTLRCIDNNIISITKIQNNNTVLTLRCLFYNRHKVQRCLHVVEQLPMHIYNNVCVCEGEERGKREICVLKTYGDLPTPNAGDDGVF
jgi:hypothetical protein